MSTTGKYVLYALYFFYNNVHDIETNYLVLYGTIV